MSKYIKQIYNKFLNRGVGHILKLIGKHFLSIYTLWQDKKFDNTYGTETSKHETEYVKNAKSGNWIYAYNYEPTEAKIFNQIMGKVKVQYSDYVFLDLGSGKGRALMLASEYPFKKIIGVEFSHEIYTIQQHNIEKFKKKKAFNCNFDLIYSDAIEYSFPDENIVLFLFNPFRGKVLKKIVDKIENHVNNTNKDLYIIYHYPLNAAIFDNQVYLESIIRRKDYIIYRKNVSSHINL